MIFFKFNLGSDCKQSSRENIKPTVIMEENEQIISVEEKKKGNILEFHIKISYKDGNISTQRPRS